MRLRHDIRVLGSVGKETSTDELSQEDSEKPQPQGLKLTSFCLNTLPPCTCMAVFRYLQLSAQMYLHS